MQRPGIGQADLEDHAVGQGRVDIAPATGHPTNGGQQQGRIAVLGGIAGSADLQRPRRHLRFVVHRQHQDRRRVVQGANPWNRLQAVDPRHGNIQQDHLARGMAQGFQQLLAIAGLPRYLHVLGQADQLLDAFTDNGVVFGNQYSNHAMLLIQGDGHAQAGALARLAFQGHAAAQHEHPLTHADQAK
ncbi:hypothetical protein D3C81_604580 [compost metagenome]